MKSESQGSRKNDTNWESRLVLIAEDSDDDYFLLSRALKKADFNNPVQRVVNGQDAIRYLSGAAPYINRVTFPFPYVVLLDLKMPIMHGFDVLSWMRKQEETQLLPVVVFTSSLQSVDIHESYKRGANGFVMKSSSVSALADVVASIHAYWVKANRIDN